ncbi:MAG: DUF1818 family protein [Cyanobacteria bacterium J06632_22]
MSVALSRQLWEGSGWRVGWNPAAAEFTALLGSEAWALELTTPELADVCRLSQQLADTMVAMGNELMDEERITCEQETERIWLEAEGFPHCYDLRLILLTGRGGEGTWPAAAVPALLATLARLASILEP